jgi:hypothetical protein
LFFSVIEVVKKGDVFMLRGGVDSLLASNEVLKVPENTFRRSCINRGCCIIKTLLPANDAAYTQTACAQQQQQQHTRSTKKRAGAPARQYSGIWTTLGITWFLRYSLITFNASNAAIGRASRELGARTFEQQISFFFFSKCWRLLFAQ